ncbi:MAG: hypothetical protein WCI49_13935 [Ferruginibacter sp.]
MKIALTLILFLLTKLLFAQTTTHQPKSAEKSITIVFTKTWGNCGIKALAIAGDTARIDTCHKKTENSFSAGSTELVKSNNLYSWVMSITTAQWMQMEMEINKINYCDYAIPFDIEVKENGREYKYSLNRISHCYPDTAKYILEALEKYFNNI